MITVFNQPRTVDETTSIIRKQLNTIYDTNEAINQTRGCDFRYRELSDNEVFDAANSDANKLGTILDIGFVILFVFALVLNATGFLVAYGVAAIVSIVILAWMVWNVTESFDVDDGMETIPFAGILPTVREANARLRNLY